MEKRLTCARESATGSAADLVPAEAQSKAVKPCPLCEDTENPHGIKTFSTWPFGLDAAFQGIKGLCKGSIGEEACSSVFAMEAKGLVTV